jgi:hypothetical protein
MGIEARYYDLTHGVHGFITLYVLIAVFQLAGMKRARATLDQYFFWPFSSLAMVVVGISISVFWLLSIVGVQFGGIGENPLAVLIAMSGAYHGSFYWAAGSRPLAAESGRGAMVLDGMHAQDATPQLPKRALPKLDTRFPFTVAGVAAPFEDEI